MFLLVYSTIKIRDTQRLPLHLQPRKDQLKSFQYCLWRLQSQLVILHCKMLVERKKDKALVDFVLIIDIKNDTCDKVEDFAAIWRKKHRKRIKRPSSDKTIELQTFGLTMTPVDYSPPRKTSRLQKNEAPRYNANFRTQDPTRFSVQEQSSLNTRIVDSGIRHFIYIINDVNFTSKKKNGSRTSPLSKRRTLNMNDNTLIM